LLTIIAWSQLKKRLFLSSSSILTRAGVNIAAKNIEDILVDHAWCEQKAASTGISMIITIRENPASR
jgi:tRNA isopentenyl-2-thiomethyl-A-37 hydroxylase MiaE